MKTEEELSTAFYIIAVIVAFLVAIVTLSMAVLLILMIIEAFYNRYLKSYFSFVGLDKGSMAILSGFTFYKGLSVTEKREFEKRVRSFIDNKTFLPAGTLPEVTTEMKVLISAAACQITFGFKHIILRSFSKIIVYPDDYYSQLNQAYHQGEVNLAGAIVLSWKNFTKGYEQKSDGINLGLHEMAHAMRIENTLRNGEYGFIDKKLLRNFDVEAQKILHSNIESPYLSEHALSNTQELFATCVELYFERPETLKNISMPLFNAIYSILYPDKKKLY
jgi:MtfA peptidase